MYTLTRLSGEEDSCLTSRVATTDHRDVGSPALLHLVRRCGVKDAAPFELFASVHFEPAIVGACRNEQALRDDRLAIVERNHGVTAVERHARSRASAIDRTAPNLFA